MEKMTFRSPASYLIIGEGEIEEFSQQLAVSREDRLILNEDLSIESVRKAIRWLNIKPYNSSAKLIVIEKLENMSNVVANALLKTLEEPPNYAVIVLISKSEKNILPTISSRCIKYRNYTNGKTDQNNINIVDLQTVQTIRTMNLKERFSFVNKLVTEKSKPEIEVILVNWQKELRKDLLAGKDVVEELKKIARAKDLTTTNISLKLLLENLVMDF